MVCLRCKMAVRAELERAGFTVGAVELGEAEIFGKLDREAIARVLEPLGFELLDNHKSKLIERVKTLIITLIYDRQNDLKTNLSDYLADAIGQDYGLISQLFSQNESMTLEQYYIVQKIERVKELLFYGEMNINEIADSLHYSSAPYLSRQFKKITGMTPGEFRKLRSAQT